MRFSFRGSIASLVVTSTFLGCTAQLSITPTEEDSQTGNEQGSNQGAVDPDGPSYLPCNQLTWCTDYKSNASEHQVQDTLGGSIRDGMYRLEKGSAYIDALIFEQNRFLRVFHGSSNTGGTYEILSNNRISFVYDTDCNENTGLSTLGANSYSTETLYRATDNTIEFDVGCTGGGPNPLVCGSDTLYRRVNDLCDVGNDFVCDASNCTCRTSEFVTFSGSSNVESCEL